jgi:hypothetical protein
MTKRNDVYSVKINDPFVDPNKSYGFEATTEPKFCPSAKEYIEEPFKMDSIVQTIVDRFESRAKFGKQKYGTDLDRNDLSVIDWIQHIQDELHDGILYLEKLKQVLNGKVEEPNK